MESTLISRSRSIFGVYRQLMQSTVACGRSDDGIYIKFEDIIGGMKRGLQGREDFTRRNKFQTYKQLF